MVVKILYKLTVLLGAALIIWMLVSWADALLHNVPFYGDKSYWTGNMFGLLIR